MTKSVGNHYSSNHNFLFIQLLLCISLECSNSEFSSSMLFFLSQASLGFTHFLIKLPCSVGYKTEILGFITDIRMPHVSWMPIVWETEVIFLLLDVNMQGVRALTFFYIGWMPFYLLPMRTCSKQYCWISVAHPIIGNLSSIDG